MADRMTERSAAGMARRGQPPIDLETRYQGPYRTGLPTAAVEALPSGFQQTLLTYVDEYNRANPGEPITPRIAASFFEGPNAYGRLEGELRRLQELRMASRPLR